MSVLAVGETNSALEFNQRDTSVTGGVAGKIASIAEYSNGPLTLAWDFITANKVERQSSRSDENQLRRQRRHRDDESGRPLHVSNASSSNALFVECRRHRLRWQGGYRHLHPCHRLGCERHRYRHRLLRPDYGALNASCASGGATFGSNTTEVATTPSPRY